MILKHRAKSLLVPRAVFPILCLLCLFTRISILHFCDGASFLLEPRAIQPLREEHRKHCKVV